MPRERKFNFVPVSNKRSSIFEKEGLYVRLRKPGAVIIPMNTLIDIGVDITKEHFGMLIYFDKEKRSIGFKVTDIVEHPKSGFRLVGIYKNGQEGKKGYYEARFNIKNILNEISNPLMGQKIKLEEYIDSDVLLSVGKVWYFEVPKAGKKDE